MARSLESTTFGASPSSRTPQRRRQRRARRGAVVVGLILIASGLSATSSLVPTAHASAGRYLQTFAAANEGYGQPRTPTQSVTDARNYDVITALPKTYQGQVAAMMRTNSRLLLLVYLNGTFAQSSEGARYPDSWYAHDKAGQKVRSRGFGNFLMNPADPGWAENRAATCRALLVSSGYTGCMLDMLGTAPTMSSYVTSLAINPVTKAPWTAADWQRTTTALAAKVGASTSGPLWGNGYGSASRYFSATLGSSQVLSSGVQGALTEVWIRTSQASLTSYPSTAQWQECVNQLIDLGRRGDRTAVLVKLWSPGTIAQKDAQHRFALSTFLLGSDGNSAFSVSYQPGDALAGHRYWDANIGSPTAAYKQVGSAYLRTFSTGKVVVNPSGSPVSVPLGGTYRDLSGALRSTAILPAHSGDVFVQA